MTQDVLHAGVVGGQRHTQIAIETIQKATEMPNPGVHIFLPGSKCWDSRAWRDGHELHQSLRAFLDLALGLTAIRPWMEAE